LDRTVAEQEDYFRYRTPRMTKSSDRRASGKFFVAVGKAVRRLAARWRQATSSDRYRPEKHYMRGPGPKSSRKDTGGDQNSK
jgi:hypothetical protein